jgi:16S rRNA (uracil1498-N3)-methyltransferase
MDGPKSPKVRLFADARLEAGGMVTLGQAPTHYLTRVMRLAPGQQLKLFNGRDGEWVAEVLAVARGTCDVRSIARERAQDAGIGPSLAFAPLKKDALDILVIKATELGVMELKPVFTEFSSVHRVNCGRLRAQAIEAAEQCGRLSVPVIDEPQSMRSFLTEWPASRGLFVLNPDDGVAARAAFAADVNTLAPSIDRAPCFLVGPEGGWSASELDALRALPFVRFVKLGPRTLRAETAAIAAVACWQALAGDW